MQLVNEVSTIYSPKLYIKKEGGLRISGQCKDSTYSRPLISVITIVYNGAEYLEETMLSVLGQSYQNVEYIIIDGGSSDGTLEIIKKYEGRIDYWVSELDEGISDAFNKGILVSSGEWIGIINAGDTYENDALEIISITHHVDIVCGKLLLFDDSREFALPAKPEYLTRMMSVNHPAVFVRREIYDRYGLFDKSYKLAMDYELLLRFYMQGASFKVVDEILACMRLGGVSDTYYLKSLYEVCRAKINNGLSRRKSFLTYIGQYARGSVLKSLELLHLNFILRFYKENFILIKRERLK